MSTNKLLIALDTDPNDGHLRASIGIERCEMGERASRNQRANFVWNDHTILRNRHGCLVQISKTARFSEFVTSKYMNAKTPGSSRRTGHSAGVDNPILWIREEAELRCYRWAQTDRDSPSPEMFRVF